MRYWTLAALFFLCAPAFSQTSETPPSAATSRKSCDDLKAEISKKLEAKGVTTYALDAVDKGKEGDGKIVGTCDGRTKSLVYSRGGAAPSKGTEEKKPQ